MLLWLAPMDWITNTSYRYLYSEIFKKYNFVDEFFLWTEFMNADGFIINPEKLIKHLLTIKSWFKTIAQIYWWNLDTLQKTFDIIQKKYSDTFYAIELNIWCPSPKVMATWWWSWMLKNKEKTLNIIKKLSSMSDINFFIKTRTWLNEEDKKEQFDFVVETSKFVDIISIHWRTLKQTHNWDVDRDYIYNIKEEASCKIIWNWWIKTYQQSLEKIWNLDWIMIWQASLWNPWIFTDYEPDIYELYKIIRQHLDLSVSCEIYFYDFISSWKKYIKQPSFEDINYIKKNIDIYLLKNEVNYKIKKTIIEFRKYLFNYVKWIPNSKEFKVKVSSINDYYELKKQIDVFFGM